ncbi:thiolase family protein [Arthrobacter sp. PAMC25564]|uniref:thiolase family protein n=1 Tax=Arthrobacter sp. PAMC25564 TaxID=2565366 RepID=UPI0010A264A9|nr:thiolase family protein [Arthrobacter sp. PAMC25564]
MIIAARRTPLRRANGALKGLRAHQLLAPVLRSLLEGADVPPEAVADVVIGNAVGGGGNVARLAALEAGLPVSVPGVTVDRQCGSGLDAIVLASRLVAAGGGGIYLAGGVESISTAPLRAHRNSDGAPEFFARAQFAPAGHGDPDMGVAAENVAVRCSVSRERQDAFALRSHHRALAAAAAGVFKAEIVPLSSSAAGSPALVELDDGPRPSLTAALLARFPAAFVAGGTVTAGNSCFDADGAAAVVITSVERARSLGARDGLLVLGTGTAGVDPQLLGTGAAAAAERLLAAQGLSAEDIGLIEFNEAFASQTLACLDRLGIDPERANLDGGALALGHAYGASGAVLVTRLLAQARRNPVEGQLALALISIAGGMGTAVLLGYRTFP